MFLFFLSYVSYMMYCWFFCLLIPRPPRSTRTDSLFPDTTLFRSDASLSGTGIQQFGMALGLFPLSLHQTACGRSRQYLAKARHAHPISRDYCRDMIRSEEHTSELQSLMRISYAVFCLKKQNIKQHIHQYKNIQTNIATNTNQ